MSKKIEFLVGDNAFHGISHLSQQRARERSQTESPVDIANASELVALSLENGAGGFMFSVSETTLAIIKTLESKPNLYPIVPYAYEYVRAATAMGGIPGIAKKISKEILFSKSVFSVAANLWGLATSQPSAFLKTYLIYELSRIRASAGKNAKINCMFLHEVITDMALALNISWIFKTYLNFLLERDIKPGFETRNLPYLVDKFQEWNIDLSKIAITASFNRIGFQMNPTQKQCEEVLDKMSGSQVIAMSVLAAGYLSPSEAAPYIVSLPNISNTVIGVSKKKQAMETFRVFENAEKENLVNKALRFETPEVVTILPGQPLPAQLTTDPQREK